MWHLHGFSLLFQIALADKYYHQSCLEKTSCCCDWWGSWWEHHTCGCLHSCSSPREQDIVGFCKNLRGCLPSLWCRGPWRSPTHALFFSKALLHVFGALSPARNPPNLKQTKKSKPKAKKLKQLILKNEKRNEVHSLSAPGLILLYTMIKPQHLTSAYRSSQFCQEQRTCLKFV